MLGGPDKGIGMMDIACPRCGLLSPPDHKFCGNCGASLKPGKAVEKVTGQSETAATAAQDTQGGRQTNRPVSGLGCGLAGGLILGGALFVQNVSRAGFVSIEAVAHLIFNVCLFGCIAAAIGYAIARAWKKVGYSLLALVLFLVLWFALMVGLLVPPGQ